MSKDFIKLLYFCGGTMVITNIAFFIIQYRTYINDFHIQTVIFAPIVLAFLVIFSIGFGGLITLYILAVALIALDDKVLQFKKQLHLILYYALILPTIINVLVILIIKAVLIT
jgi:hypothetical protein